MTVGLLTTPSGSATVNEWGYIRNILGSLSSDAFLQGSISIESLWRQHVEIGAATTSDVITMTLSTGPQECSGVAAYYQCEPF